MSQKLTDRAKFTATISTLDLLHIVDVSDHSQDPAGSSYKLEFSKVSDFIKFVQYYSTINDSNGSALPQRVYLEFNDYLTVTDDSTDGITNVKFDQSKLFVDKEVPTGTKNSSNVTFVLAHTPITGSEHVFLNGMLLQSGVGGDYTISGATITFNTAPDSTDKLVVTYRK